MDLVLKPEADRLACCYDRKAQESTTATKITGDPCLGSKYVECMVSRE